MKILTLTLLMSSICFAITGCVSIKQADIKEATFNTAGWKSQAGINGGANIEATTIPSTDLSAPGL